MGLSFTKKISIILVLLPILIVGFLGFKQIGNAQTAEELLTKIETQNQEIKRLEKEIAEFQKQLQGISKEADSLANALKKIELTRKTIASQIKVTEDKIESRNLSIKKIQSEIGIKKNSIGENYNVLKDTVRTLNEKGNPSMFEMIAISGSISNLWREVDDLQLFQTSLREHLGDLEAAKGNLESSESKEQALRNELLNLQQDLVDQKKLADNNAKEKEKLLKETKNQESNYKKIVANKTALKESFEKELRDYESQLKFILDPSKLPAEGSAVLSWPTSDVYITQYFGQTFASKRLYASGSHNGMDFRGAVGSPVLAMADGVVIGTGDTDLACVGASFGRWILIEYDVGLSSTYGHLSIIKVSPGQRVTRGQIVGYSGNTGYSTGPHLHVSLYANGSVEILSRASKACTGKIYTMPFAALNGYLDPMLYLPTPLPSQVKPGAR